MTAPAVHTPARRTHPSEDTTIAKPQKNQTRGRFRDMTRINDRIRAPKVRVVTSDGQQLGVMSSREALAKAQSLGLDLVEIAGQVDPPVCKIVDYGKYKYEQAKLKKQKSKSSTRMKEVKFRVGFVVLNRIIEDLKTMAQVDQPPRLNGRAVAMILSPLPAHQRKRKFHLFHGELMDEDDFEDEENHDADLDDEVPDEVPDEVFEAIEAPENTQP